MPSRSCSPSRGWGGGRLTTITRCLRCSCRPCRTPATSLSAQGRRAVRAGERSYGSSQPPADQWKVRLWPAGGTVSLLALQSLCFPPFGFDHNLIFILFVDPSLLRTNCHARTLTLPQCTRLIQTWTYQQTYDECKEAARGFMPLASALLCHDHLRIQLSRVGHG